jgi:(p)ppGpp synthase/HD superfamily hydrolase
MQKFKTLADAVALAEFAHRNQVDKAGLPYIEHPRRVLAKVQAQGALPYVQMAAILHDVTEDTAFTPDMLLNLGVPEAAVEIIKLVDRDHSKSEHETLIQKCHFRDNYRDGWSEEMTLAWAIPVDEFYYANIKRNPGAVQIKLADIEDNLSPWRLTYLAPETQTRLRTKYAKAIELLNPRPVNHGLVSPDYVYDPYTIG